MVSDSKRWWAGEGLSWRLQVLVFLVAAFAVVSRRPDVLLNPQFWAEDGTIWYAQAYNVGWLHSLALPDGGYLNTLPRLAASAALLIPLRFAPLLLNICGITLQVLPANILMSSRCSGWSPLSVRMLQAGVYIALPNSWEIDVNITDAHFHLALAAFLLAVGNPPKNWKWRAFDVSILFLSGLTGPWCLILLPIVLVFWWVRRFRWSLVVAGIVAVCAAVQAAELPGHTGLGGRAAGALGATPILFLRILAGNVFTGALIGQNAFGLHSAVPGIVIVAALGISILLYTLLKGRLELKLFILFCFLLFAASLKAPLISGPLPQWQLLLVDQGARYWFLPMVAFLWSLVWCASQSQFKSLQLSCALALLVMTRGVVRDWKYPPYKDEHFQEYAEMFNSAPFGAVVQLPINPDGWTVRLIKRDKISEHRHPLLPLGFLDQPPRETIISKTAMKLLLVSGWAFSEDGIEEVSIYLDRSFLEDARKGFPRPDVRTVFRSESAASSGWSAFVDLNGVLPGPHEIIVQIKDKNGAIKDVSAPITVQP